MHCGTCKTCVFILGSVLYYSLNYSQPENNFLLSWQGEGKEVEKSSREQNSLVLVQLLAVDGGEILEKIQRNEGIGAHNLEVVLNLLDRV
jgi:hypothetical protein